MPHEEMSFIDEVLDLVSIGQIDKAIAICNSFTEHSDFFRCAREIGWYFYDQTEYDEAMFWFEKALSTGDIESEYAIGCIFFNKKMYKEALPKFQKCLDCGYFRCCLWMGLIYEYGLNGERSICMAKEVYRKGAENGYLMCDRSLIKLRIQEGGLYVRFTMCIKLVAIVIKSFFIALNDVHDERIVDVPNAFK